MLKVDKFNVRIVRRGDRYGRDDMFAHEEDQPLVETIRPAHLNVVLNNSRRP